MERERSVLPILSRQNVIFIAYNTVTYHCVSQTYTTGLSYMVSEVGVSAIRVGDIKSRIFSIESVISFSDLPRYSTSDCTHNNTVSFRYIDSFKSTVND